MYEIIFYFLIYSQKESETEEISFHQVMSFSVDSMLEHSA